MADVAHRHPARIQRYDHLVQAAPARSPARHQLTQKWFSRLSVDADRPNRLVVIAQLNGNPAVHVGTLSVRLRTPEAGRVVAFLSNLR
ncbi:hypothetical protein [Pseudonocardia adelaidensis]|uniref:hypothetical protein n=1 Tax=Pseudonocardia adelaidensis TaxID=648754 RepID=UPI0031E75A00